MKEDSHRPEEYKHQEWLFLGLMCFVASVFNFALVLLIHQWWSFINLACAAAGLMLSGFTIRRYQEGKD